MTKRALIIGINYIGTSSSLNGCINDAHNMKVELEKRGYLPENIILLSDDTEIQPTRRNILRELLDLILSGCEDLFFHYSGHGSYVKDTDGDEIDGRDECLVPIDYKESGMVIDDEIRGLLCSLSKNQRMLCVMDSCHSGSGTDLKYNLYERYGGVYLSMKNDGKYAETRGECIMFSGSRDSGYSADAWIEGTTQGAMTHSFLKSIKRNNITYEELITGIRSCLKEGGFKQIPNLSSGRRLKLSDRVKI